jgi:hypothetical protein
VGAVRLPDSDALDVCELLFETDVDVDGVVEKMCELLCVGTIDVDPLGVATDGVAELDVDIDMETETDGVRFDRVGTYVSLLLMPIDRVEAVSDGVSPLADCVRGTVSDADPVLLLDELSDDVNVNDREAVGVRDAESATDADSVG